MNLSLNCIKCDSLEGLNTAMNVTYNNNVYNVKICDKCSDTITPKVVKDCVEGKLNEFIKLKEQMARFGIKIDESETGNLIDKLPVSDSSVQEKSKVQVQNGPKISRNFISDKAIPRVNATQLPQINVNSAIKNESEKAVAKGSTKGVTIVQEDVELQSVDGLGKVPTVIQKRIKDSTGQTNITIAKVTNDDLIKKTKSGDGHFYADGYNLKQCALCKGSGVTINDTECPKCKGSGLI